MCKSRLIPELGEKGAAELQARLVDKIINDLNEFMLCPVEIWQSEETDYFITRYCNFEGITIHTQTGNNLGERMSNAISSTIEKTNKIILIGSDCVLYTKQYLTQAIHSLDNTIVVFGPAVDGGYVLLGVSQNIPIIFKDINWGTDKVLEKSKENLRSLGVSFSLLDQLWDIDTPSDLNLLRESNPEMMKLTK